MCFEVPALVPPGGVANGGKSGYNDEDANDDDLGIMDMDDNDSKAGILYFCNYLIFPMCFCPRINFYVCCELKFCMSLLRMKFISNPNSESLIFCL